MLASARSVLKRASARNIFQTMHNLGVGKKKKVAQNSPMFTQSDFHTSADLRACAAAKSVKRASVLDLITLATYI